MTNELPQPVQGGQHVGEIVDRHPFGGGPQGRMGTYFVRDDEDGNHYSFSYDNIVTEGFRTIRVGERVRFFTDTEHLARAAYVVRLDEPDLEDFYR